MKTADRLCVAVGVALAAWGAMVCYDTRRVAEWYAKMDNESDNYAIIIRNNGLHGLPLLGGGLGLAGFGLTGLRRRSP